MVYIGMGKEAVELTIGQIFYWICSVVYWQQIPIADVDTLLP